MVASVLLVATAAAQRLDEPASLSNDPASQPTPYAPPDAINAAVGERLAPATALGTAPPVASTIDPAEAEARGMAHLDPDRFDPAAAVPWLEQAAEAGRPLAQMSLARMHLRGDGVAPNPERTFELYKAAAEQGMATAQVYVGLAYLAGQEPVERDSSAGRRWLVAAARQEHGTALAALSQLYRTGDGVDVDGELADALLMRAAEVGNALAQRDAANMLLYGSAERRDRTKGVYFLKKAADADEPTAVYILGREYLAGLNVEQSFSLAGDALARAADRNPLAALWLSEMYSKGIGFPQDVEHARALLEATLARASTNEKNRFAWELAVTRDALLRNGALAVEIMETVVENPEHRVPSLLDTLAAAYAEAGRFNDAVEAELAAIEALPADVSEAVIAPMLDRAEMYRQGQAYRP